MTQLKAAGTLVQWRASATGGVEQGTQRVESSTSWHLEQPWTTSVGEGGSQPAKPSTLVPTGASAATSTHQLQPRTSFKCLQAGDGFVKEECVNGGKQGGQQHIVC